MADWNTYASTVSEACREVLDATLGNKSHASVGAVPPRQIDLSTSLCLAIFSALSELQSHIMDNKLNSEAFGSSVGEIEPPTSSLLAIRSVVEKDAASSTGVSNSDLESLEQPNQRLAEYAGTVRVALENLAPRFPLPEHRAGVWSISEKLRDRVDRYTSLGEIQGARDEIIGTRNAAREAVSSSRSATGEIGSSAQAYHYEAFATTEGRTANSLRTGAIAILMLLAAGAVVFAFASSGNNIISTEIVKLAAALPLAVLAAYLGRESGRHRDSSNWARELAMQLRSFDAFTEPLPDEEKNAVRLEFSRLLFVKVDRRRSGPERGPSVTNEAVKLLDAASRATTTRKTKLDTPPSSTS